MRRWSLAIVLVAAIATGSAGAAQDAQRISYWQATGRAQFSYTIDYGSHPDGVFNGRYIAQLVYTIRTLVTFDGRRISTAARPVVDGSALVASNMTAWTGGPRTPVRCDEPSFHRTNSAERSSGAHVSVGGGLAHIDPGSAIKWAVGCAATESLAAHGLPDGKTITGGASIRGFRGGIACSDSYQHSPDLFDPNGHSFSGKASFSLRFTPIPSKTLAGAKRALRRQVGRRISYRPPREGSFRDCLDTR